MAVLIAKWVIFIIVSLLAIVSSLLMITRRNTIHSALFMVLAFVASAILYLLLGCQFMAMIQVIVYAGAVMMLIIFVIMMLDLSKEEKLKMKVTKTKIAGVIVSVLFMMMLILMAAFNSVKGKMGTLASIGDAKTIGSLLFTRFLLPFEVASILLLAAMVGAVMLSKKKAFGGEDQ
ncbi:MAG: NADH-quinone oxidoreductase subunit J [Deltaproteobacteria bacterium]|nr:MAG: NADH-quinone oxidoreductase subunit J [Deltaproteobacteria bacterium]